jgi:N,N'-diacetyllegionaminate synthase
LLKVLRPGGGISPQEIDKMLGRRLIRAIPENQALQWGDLE